MSNVTPSIEQSSPETLYLPLQSAFRSQLGNSGTCPPPVERRSFSLALKDGRDREPRPLDDLVQRNIATSRREHALQTIEIAGEPKPLVDRPGGLAPRAQQSAPDPRRPSGQDRVPRRARNRVRHRRTSFSDKAAKRRRTLLRRLRRPCGRTPPASPDDENRQKNRWRSGTRAPGFRRSPWSASCWDIRRSAPSSSPTAPSA